MRTFLDQAADAWPAVQEALRGVGEWCESAVVLSQASDPDSLSAVAAGIGLLILVLLVAWGGARYRAREQQLEIIETIDALPEPGASVAVASTPKTAAGVRVETLLGTIVFPNSHKVGKVGDNLSALHFVGRGYKKKKSKRTSVHGIDGVYVRSRGRSSARREVVVIENKINKSNFESEQLSSQWIRAQCAQMLASGDAELVETAEIIKSAMSAKSKDKCVCLLVRHDLRKGRSTRHCVDADGNVTSRQVSWNNSRHMRMVLLNALKKGRAWREGEGAT